MSRSGFGSAQPPRNAINTVWLFITVNKATVKTKTKLKTKPGG